MNVAKTQDVPLDGTIFLGNTGQKDEATFMNKNIPIELSFEYPKLVETYRNQVLLHGLTWKLEYVHDKFRMSRWTVLFSSG